MGLKHSFKSLKADPADATVIGASKWNADHYFLDTAGTAIGSVGDLAYRGTSGLVTLLSGAVGGGLLSSTGIGNVPTWVTTATLQTLILNNNVGNELYFAGAGNSTNITSEALIALTAAGSLQFGANSVSNIVQLTSSGLMYPTDNTYDFGSTTTRARMGYFGTGVAVGTNAAQSGVIRIPNSTSIMSRNAANTSDLQIAVLDGSNVVRVGQAGLTAVMLYATDIRSMVPLVSVGGGATATLGTIGGSGPTAAAMTKWMRWLDDGGAAFWVPVWK